MLKIKAITIENFRGIKAPLKLDFYKGGNATSVVIYGRNGTGKSSIVDAWEWLNNFEIKELQKENVSTADYPHKLSGGDNCSIKVECSTHATITQASATFNKKKITTPITGGQYADFRTHTIYPNYLRYSDLQEFVYMSKTDKYKFIARFFGLESFMKNQAEIRACITRLEAKLQQLENSLSGTQRTISSIVGSSIITETAIISFINTIATRHSIPVITEFKEAQKVKTALDALVRANPVAGELAVWKAFNTRLNTFYPLIALDNKVEDLESAFADLKKDEQNITKLILTELYDKSILVLDKLDDKTLCPLCDTPFSGDIIEHIKQKHSALKELQILKSNYENKRGAVERYFTSLQSKITVIKGENSPIILEVFKDFFELITQIELAIPSILDELRKPIAELVSITLSSNPIFTLLATLYSDEEPIKKQVTDKITALSSDLTSKTLADDLTALARLIPEYTNFLKVGTKVQYLKNIILDLEATYEKLTAFIQLQIQNTFTAIQADLADCYNLLESSNVFLKNPEIKLVVGRDKAVELEIEFVGAKTTPAFKVMSESQVNSFGLSIFLSAVKHFNPNFKFIILDDVVNSFDSFKRPRVTSLLHSKFGDFQCLLLTHDQIFFDTVQKQFPSWQRYKFTGWDYSLGPKFKLSRSYVEDIQHELDEDAPIKAGQTLGRYLEWILGMINENLETPLRYKVENIYTLMELYEPLVSRLNQKLKQTGRTHKLIAEFNTIEQGTIFRNYCAHWKDEANAFTSPEIDGVFKKWLEIEKMLYCDSCKDFVGYSKTGSTEYLKCSCGGLDLKDSSFYS